jgi:hypothetical protein
VLSSRLGLGCVDDADLAALAALIDRAAALEGAEARPLAAAAAEIVEWSVAAADGSGALQLVRDGGRWRGERGGAPFAVEDEEVERVVAALTSPWPATDALGAPAAATRLGRVTARHRDGTALQLQLVRAAGRLLLVRDGERLGLAPPPGLELAPAALLAALAARSLWYLEPTAVERLVLDGRAFARGAVLGEWLDGAGRPLPAAVAAQLERLVGALAALRATSRRPHRVAAAHHLELSLAADPSRAAPQGGAPGERHTLELARQAGECLGRADGADAQLPPSLCEQVQALARAPLR